MKHHFVLRDMSSNEEIPLISKAVTLGRTQDCEIVVNSSEASRKHARISLDDGKLTLEDLGSTNGTFLNGRQLRKAEALGGGDIIVIGQVRYLVIAPGSSGEMTILGGRLGRVDDNYVVEQTDPHATGMRMAFPMPHGWAVDESLAGKKPVNRSSLDVLTTEMNRQSIGTGDASAVLMAINGEQGHKLFTLEAGKDAWTLGRTANNDAEISHVTISSLHALVTTSSGMWQIEDKNSTNGTRVNGHKIDVSGLKDGDTISLGKVELLFKSL